MNILNINLKYTLSRVHSTYTITLYFIDHRKDIPKLSALASYPDAMINPQWLGPLMYLTNFHGPEDIRAVIRRIIKFQEWSEVSSRKHGYIVLTPLKPHFFIVKLGFTGYTLFFTFLPKNIDCGYSLEPTHRNGSNEYPNLCFEQKYEKHKSFLSGNFSVFEVKFSIYLNRRVFVMNTWWRVNIYTYQNVLSVWKQSRNWSNSMVFCSNL